MDISHLRHQPFPIPLHAATAMVALTVGVVQLRRPKGTMAHRVVGYLWVLMMAVVAVSGFFIFEIRLWGPYSPIHLLSIVVIASLWLAIQAARKGNIERHRRIMKSLFFFALVLAGILTLLPGRTLHHVVFGGS